MTCCRECFLSRATQVLALLAFCAALRYVAWRWRRVVDTSYWVRYVQRGGQANVSDSRARLYRAGVPCYVLMCGHLIHCISFYLFASI